MTASPRRTVLDALLRRPVFVGYPDHEHAAVRPELRKRSPAAPAGEPRRRDGSHARPEDPATAPGRRGKANPRGSHQATGSYRSNGSYPANGYPGNGYPGNWVSGQWLSRHPGPTAATATAPPYDPRDDYQRLTHQL